MISIIIPVLNEADTIENLLYYLVDCAKLQNISEIIVVDGGSTDNTKNSIQNFVTSSNSKHREELYRETSSNVIDTKFSKKNFTRTDVKFITDRNPKTNSGLINQPNILLIDSPKGRAKQMNLGAKQAKGDILYFLHADSFPPINYDELIIAEVKKGNNAGCFSMQFDSAHWWLLLASWFTQFSWRACRGGDQSQFITRALFEDIGGYNEDYIIYEDNILINELYKRKQFVVINKKLKTSARLYKKHGIWKLQYHFLVIYLKRWTGSSAKDLFAYYKKHIC